MSGAPKVKSVVVGVVVIVVVAALGCCGVGVFGSADDKDKGTVAVRPVRDVPSGGGSSSATSPGAGESTAPAAAGSPDAAGSPAQPAATPTTPAPAPPAPAKTTRKPPNCDPSYPDMCLPPGAPDLDCPDVAPAMIAQALRR